MNKILFYAFFNFNKASFESIVAFLMNDFFSTLIFLTLINTILH